MTDDTGVRCGGTGWRKVGFSRAIRSDMKTRCSGCPDCQPADTEQGDDVLSGEWVKAHMKSGPSAAEVELMVSHETLRARLAAAEAERDKAREERDSVYAAAEHSPLAAAVARIAELEGALRDAEDVAVRAAEFIEDVRHGRRIKCLLTDLRALAGKGENDG